MPILGASFKDGKGRGYLLGDIMQQAEENLAKKISSKVDIPIRKMGSAALDMAYVAAGRYDGFWQRNLNYWDIAAGIILVREAGGFVADFMGNDKYVDNKTILVTNSKINEAMIEVLNN